MGRVVPVGDVTAFKNALLDVLHHPESFDPEIMRSFVLKNYSPEAISQQMRNLYQPLINRTS
jgi:glycosyltransferase involved in cell wall biosynthesis